MGEEGWGKIGEGGGEGVELEGCGYLIMHAMNHGNLLWRGWGDYTVMLAEQTACYTIMEQLLHNTSKMTTTPSTNQSKIVFQCYPNAPPMAVQRLPNASTSLRQSSPDAPPMRTYFRSVNIVGVVGVVMMVSVTKDMVREQFGAGPISQTNCEN
ncbi:hypothetical protein BT69DRAFT_1295986 [Atractiella rhizophila]|nr:hypothetical protein BT69DRAFT_1295986 [Atractiella rhizophila]